MGSIDIVWVFLLRETTKKSYTQNSTQFTHKAQKYTLNIIRKQRRVGSSPISRTSLKSSIFKALERKES